jgi:hypothetical protein
MIDNLIVTCFKEILTIGSFPQPLKMLSQNEPVIYPLLPTIWKRR